MEVLLRDLSRSLLTSSNKCLASSNKKLLETISYYNKLPFSGVGLVVPQRQAYQEGRHTNHQTTMHTRCIQGVPKNCLVAQLQSCF